MATESSTGSSRPKRVSFLMGAGASRDAGFPLGADIMEMVLKKMDYHYRNESFLPWAEIHQGEMYKDHDVRDRAQRIILAVKEMLDEYYRQFPGAITTYEAIANELEMIADPFHHPSVNCFRAELQKRMGLVEKYLLNDDIRLAQRFINDIVYGLTSHPPTRNDTVGYVIEALRSDSVSCQAVITLNYDTVVECALKAHGISFEDGFGTETYDFSPQLLETPTPFLYLKLHGSVEWWLVQEDNENFWRIVKQPPSIFKGDVFAHKQILIGTESKLMKYVEAPFSFLRASALRVLERTDVLVVIGYSFGDRGVNAMLNDWMYSHPERSMLVVDQDAEGLRQRSGEKYIWRGTRGWLMNATGADLSWRRILDCIQTSPTDFSQFGCR